jgi:hypothetical protein
MHQASLSGMTIVLLQVKVNPRVKKRFRVLVDRRICVAMPNLSPSTLIPDAQLTVLEFRKREPTSLLGRCEEVLRKTFASTATRPSSAASGCAFLRNHLERPLILETPSFTFRLCSRTAGNGPPAVPHPSSRTRFLRLDFPGPVWKPHAQSAHCCQPGDRDGTRHAVRNSAELRGRMSPKILKAGGYRRKLQNSRAASL